jgi:hypothetical protein
VSRHQHDLARYKTEILRSESVDTRIRLERVHQFAGEDRVKGQSFAFDVSECGGANERQQCEKLHEAPSSGLQYMTLR